MDDCNLEKLVVKPGKLSPNFHKDTTEYAVTVASDVAKIRVEPLTSDTGASYSISGSGGGKEVELPEGTVTDIKIEVTSEDGTIKNYFIHVKRLSAKDATLSDLKLDVGKLEPDFSPDVTSYSCLLPCHLNKVTVKPTAPDTKNVVLVCGEKPGTPTTLNVGETNIQIEVTSADGSNKQNYSLDVMKKQIPRYIKFTDAEQARQYECPISLNPLYRPISIRGSDPKHTYSAPLIDNFTRTSKLDPLNEMPLDSDWRIVDYELDKKMATLPACIPLTYGGASDTAKFGDLGPALPKCNIAPKVEDLKEKFKDSVAPLSHKVEIRKWEKSLQQIFDETNVDILVKNAQGAIHKYFESLPRPGEKKQFADGCSPLDYLQLASHNYATAIKLKPKDPNLHLQLGLVLEERYYSEDIFGLKKEEGGEALPSFNFEAKESSKSEECDAICKLRGVDASTAPIALQLKAIDEEYHNLVNSGQSGKADHVMKLFAWKSKQASQEGAAAQKASDEESPLGQAYLKMMDALVLDEAKAFYNFHVGRLLMVQGNYEDAVKRLEVTLGWNPAHQLARSYLGLALALQKTGPGARAKETIGYLMEAMEILLTELSKSSMSDADPSAVNPILYGDDLIRSTNVHLLRGIVQLGRLLQQNPDKDCIAAKDVFHTSALLASQVLPRICKGDTYKQMEWILLDSHSNLLEMLSSNQSGNEKIIAQRCERLSALIFHSTIPMNDQLLGLQETTCQKLVQIQPCNSHSLYLLGVAQFSKFENSQPGDAANKLLQDVKSSFGASISLEGKPAAGELPDSVKEQEWFQQKIKQEEEKKKALEAKQASAAKPVAAGAKGAPAARGGPAARGAPAARGRGAPAAKAAPAPRGGARGGTQAARGAKAPPGKAAPAAGKAAAPQSKPHVCEPTPPPADKKAEPEPAKPAEPPKQEPPSNAPINRKTYHPRLGLARAHRAANEIEDSQKYYNEVIVMAPEVHDAYIELAEMLAKSNPAAAVEIYSKFPISDPPTFDDAYIIGEIVRLLMKAESYGDPKLEKYMILYGRVLGLPVLEKYVKILEDKFKTDLLKKVYAGVNMKAVDDPDLEAFFKFKCWI